MESTQTASFALATIALVLQTLRTRRDNSTSLQRPSSSRHRHLETCHCFALWNPQPTEEDIEKIAFMNKEPASNFVSSTTTQRRVPQWTTCLTDAIPHLINVVTYLAFLITVLFLHVIKGESGMICLVGKGAAVPFAASYAYRQQSAGHKFQPLVVLLCLLLGIALSPQQTLGVTTERLANWMAVGMATSAAGHELWSAPVSEPRIRL